MPSFKILLKSSDVLTVALKLSSYLCISSAIAQITFNEFSKNALTMWSSIGYVSVHSLKYEPQDQSDKTWSGVGLLPIKYTNQMALKMRTRISYSSVKNIKVVSCRFTSLFSIISISASQYVSKGLPSISYINEH